MTWQITFPSLWYLQIINVSLDALIVTDKILYRPLSDCYLTKLNEYLLTADWSLITNDSDINADYDYSSKTISSALNLIAPVKSLKCNHKTSEKPWLTSALIVSCRTKSKLYNDALNDPNKLNMYKTYRNKLNKTIRAAKAKYFNDFVIQHKHDSRKIWKIINPAVGELMTNKPHTINMTANELK